MFSDKLKTFSTDLYIFLKSELVQSRKLAVIIIKQDRDDILLYLVVYLSLMLQSIMFLTEK